MSEVRAPALTSNLANNKNAVKINKAANLKVNGFICFCRGDRTRTCDSLVPNQERYQLRYTSFLRVQRYAFFATLANFSAIIL